MTIIAAADGSALGNPGPAGWGWYVDPDHWACGGWPHGTNNMGELTAVLDLLQQTASVGEPLVVYCDSKYVINSVTKWMAGWKRKGWKKADGKPVLNVEIMKALDAAMEGRDVRFEWVKGHAGHPLNEAADRLANGAAVAYSKGGTPDPGPGMGAGPAASAVEARGTARAEDDLLALLDEPAPSASGTRLGPGVSGALRTFAGWVARGSVGHPVFDGYEAQGHPEAGSYWDVLQKEPSAMETLFAVFANNLELDSAGDPTNIRYAERRAAAYLYRYVTGEDLPGEPPVEGPEVSLD